jgi:hypothetical protein
MPNFAKWMSQRDLTNKHPDRQRCEAFSSRETQRLQRGRGRQIAGARRPPPISGEIGHKKCFTALPDRYQRANVSATSAAMRAHPHSRRGW